VVFQYVDGDFPLQRLDERRLIDGITLWTIVNLPLSQVPRPGSATQKDLDEAAKIINGK